MLQLASINDLMALVAAASDDVRACTELLSPVADTPFARRTLVRTVFAYVEAWASIQRCLLLGQHKLGVIVLSQAEHALLQAEAYDLDSAGRPQARPNRLPDGHRLVRFLLATGARAFAVADPPDFSTSGWASFCAAWKVRNRLTHPAHVSDLALSDNDLRTVHEGYLWFCSISTRMSEQCRATLATHLRSGA